MLAIDLTGKRALIAGVSDDGGFGFAIARSLAEAGATILLGSWPPALGIFTKLLERGKIEESMKLGGGRRLEFEKIYPLDAAFDTLADVPAEIRENKRYREQGDFTIEGLVAGVTRDFGESSLDIVVHSLANGPEVRKPLVDTSRRGYLEAVSVSAYSNIAMVRGLAPLMRRAGFSCSPEELKQRAERGLDATINELIYYENTPDDVTDLLLSVSEKAELKLQDIQAFWMNRMISASSALALRASSSP